jgi:TfoX/Sxy family transcriptional regulator of competence genes
MPAPSDGHTPVTIPKPTAESVERFKRVAGRDERASLRPMFGNLAAFANGYLFAGLFGDSVFVRADATTDAAIKAAGGAPFAPMPGRPMTGYVVLPVAWAIDDEHLRAALDTSLDHTMALPPKPPKPPKAKKAKKA